MERLKKKDLIEEGDNIHDDNYASKFREGVEVIDVKAVPKRGIPGKNKSWDKLS